MTRIIAFVNQKGGVGKTTTCANLGYALAEKGRRVLLVDNDPQANLTSYFAGNGIATRTLDELYLAKRGIENPAEYIHVVRPGVSPESPGLDLVAGEGSLSGVEYYLVSMPEKEHVLRNRLAPVLSRYDYVLIDNPPSIGLLTLNALCTATHVIVPVQTEYFSLEGVVKIRKVIDGIKASHNPSLQIMGLVANQFDSRRKLSCEVVDCLEQELGSLVFRTRIRENVKIAESAGHAQSVLRYAPGAKGAEDFIHLADEVMAHEIETRA